MVERVLAGERELAQKTIDSARRGFLGLTPLDVARVLEQVVARAQPARAA